MWWIDLGQLSDSHPAMLLFSLFNSTRKDKTKKFVGWNKDGGVPCKLLALAKQAQTWGKFTLLTFKNRIGWQELCCPTPCPQAQHLHSQLLYLLREWCRGHGEWQSVHNGSSLSLLSPHTSVQLGGSSPRSAALQDKSAPAWDLCEH